MENKTVSEEYLELLNEAERAMENAYVPYSHFKVGAALLCADGRIFKGCNIENASYGCSNCAERTAVFKAVSEGVQSFKAIAIVSSSGEITYPCGICRQVLAEFSSEIDVVMRSCNGDTAVYKLTELLPHSFGL